MSMASRLLAVSAVALAFSTPLVVFSALDVGVDTGGKEKGNALDACKTGSVDATKGKVTGGDVLYDNIIEIKRGRIYIKCARAPEDREGMVSFCNAADECTLLYKDSQKGKNLLELYGVAEAVAVPHGNGFFTANPHDVLTRMLSDSQMKAVDSMIGKQTLPGFGEAADYSTVINLATSYSAPDDPRTTPKNSYRESVEQAIEAMAQPASIPRAPDITSGLPIAIDPSIQRDWSKPNRVDFLPIWQNAEVMDELYWRQKNDYNANERVQNTFEDLLRPAPVAPMLASTPSNKDTKSFTPGWLTRTYDSFIKFLFGR